MRVRSLVVATIWVGACMGIVVGVLTVIGSGQPWYVIPLAFGFFAGFAVIIAGILAGTIWIMERLG